MTPEAWQVRPYPQLLRGPTHRWWRPLVGLAVVVTSMGAVVVLLGALAVVALAGGAVTSAELSDQAWITEWSAGPVGLLANNLVLAALIPASMVAVWVGHGWSPRWLGSVRGGVRRDWLARCVLVCVITFTVLTLGTLLLSGPFEWSPEPRTLWLIAIVLLTTPLQAAGEEYLFRGWLTQAVGSLVPRAVLGGLLAGALSSTLFALAHGSQSLWLFADRFAFGVVASWLVWRTGGLEASVAAHAVNNIAVFVPTILGGGLAEALMVSEVNPVSVLIDIGGLVLLAGILTMLAGRCGVVSRFVPPPVGSRPARSGRHPHRHEIGVPGGRAADGRHVDAPPGGTGPGGGRGQVGGRSVRVLPGLHPW
jgi:membrane protease YdiL (CAAX protease family)